MASIFSKQRPKPSQMRAVADRRFDDASALCDTGKNAHANGAQYFLGLVLEILLKAKLSEIHPEIAAVQPKELSSEHDRMVWSLIWRSHDLHEMLDYLPQVVAAVKRRSEVAGRDFHGNLVKLCGRWTIFARYSTMTSAMTEAIEFRERVRELKELLK